MEIKIPIVIDDEALQKAVDKRVAELKQEGDFVIVTRCKDCKNWHKTHHKSNGDILGVCEEFTTDRLPTGGRKAFATGANDFCSYAEPKESEGERE